MGNKNAYLRQDKTKIVYKFARKEGNNSETYPLRRELREFGGRDEP